MPDRDGNSLPPLQDEVFDGEKYSVKVKTKKCPHEPELIDATHIRCKKCGVGWEGPQIGRLYEAFKRR